jgi:uncharacterized repeat protein (TIGR01451 family)
MALRCAPVLICLLLALPAGAQAAVTFGAPAALQPIAADTPTCCTDRYLGAPTAPSDGVLVRWTLRRTGPAVSVAPAVLHAGVPVADAPTTATDAAVRLPIHVGDQLGFRQSGSMPQAFNGSTLLVSGVIEPDADADGYGDETQDACPLEASLHVATCHADIALTMNGPAFGVVDRETPYDVTVANHGPSAAADVTLTDVIPAGARFVRTAGAGTCTPGATLRCTLPAIAPNSKATVTIVLAGTSEGASIHHAVSVTTSSIDATPGDHGAAIDTLVTGASVPPTTVPTLASPPCANPGFGGRDDDVLFGSAFGDRLFGRAGRDLLRGRAGNDCLYGGDGNDVLDGDGGNDSLWGSDGRDRLFGGSGNDRLLGGAKADELHGDTGNDEFAAGTGRDRVWAGPGNDTISARDGSRDVIDCGAGVDRVTADRRDRVRRCERVSRR